MVELGLCFSVCKCGDLGKELINLAVGVVDEVVGRIRSITLEHIVRSVVAREADDR